MLTVRHYNLTFGGVVYGYIHIYDDYKPLGSFHVYDKTGQASGKDTAIEAFFRTDEYLAKANCAGKLIKIESDFSDYGYAILAGAPLPKEEETGV